MKIYMDKDSILYIIIGLNKYKIFPFKQGCKGENITYLNFNSNMLEYTLCFKIGKFYTEKPFEIKTYNSVTMKGIFSTLLTYFTVNKILGDIVNKYYILTKRNGAVLEIKYLDTLDVMDIVIIPNK